MECDAMAIHDGWHRGQTWQTCPTRQRQQQGFYLVVCVLGQGHVFDLSTPVVLQRLGQRTVAGLTGSIFWAFTGGMRRVHALHHQRYVHARTQRHAMRLKAISRSLQTMVNMYRMHLTRPTGGAGNQQGGGIGPAAERHGEVA
jgi:hypothetical protein